MFQHCKLYPFVHSAGLYIRNERSRNPSYTFKDYLNEVVLKGTQNMSEGKLSKHPYQHTRKEAVSMTANQIVSNDPNMRKVSLISRPSSLTILQALIGSASLSLRNNNNIPSTPRVCPIRVATTIIL